MLYYTFATPWYKDLHMFSETKSLIMSANLKEVERREESIASFASALRATVSVSELSPGGRAHSADAQLGSYGHPHYTERFDLLIAEALSTGRGVSISSPDAMKNAAAAIRFSTISVVEKQRCMQQTVDAFSASGSLHKKKCAELQALQVERRAARGMRAEGETEADPGFIPASSFRGMRAGYTYKTGEEGLGYYRETESERASSNIDVSATSSSIGASMCQTTEEVMFPPD